MANPSIDPKHLERTRELSGKRTKIFAITKAVREFHRAKATKRLRHLVGKLGWDTAYDYKAERGRD